MKRSARSEYCVSGGWGLSAQYFKGACVTEKMKEGEEALSVLARTYSSFEWT